MIEHEGRGTLVGSFDRAAGVYMQKAEDGLLTELKFEMEKLIEIEPEIGPAVSRILIDNWADGRIAKFFNSKTEDSVYDYVCRVVKYYKKCHPFVLKIERGHPAAWDLLLEKMRKWAYSFFRKKRLPDYLDFVQISNDCANDAGARLINIRFPYDVHYESWVCRVVQNVCLNHIRQFTDKLDYADLDYDLSETDEWLHELGVPSGAESVEKRMDLFNAIEQLSSEDRKIFIHLYYFEGKSFREIAAILDRTTNALYKLHFDALENLRKILGGTSYIEGEDE